MSMISRYKKSGGFKQLLTLVETSGKAKQEKFLNIIAEEDPIWAETIKQKMLSLERVLNWDPEPLAEVFSRINDATMTIAYHILSKEQWESITQTFSHSKVRNLVDNIDKDKEPNAAQKSTAIINILVEVRKMISEGYIRLDKIDPDLIIEDDIEESLAMRRPTNFKKAKGNDKRSERMDREVEADVERIVGKNGNPEALAEIRKELIKLKKKIVILGNENHNLRQENDDLKSKVENIKKLVA